jgi:hypothetical protein
MEAADMKTANVPGPTRQDKTIERMQQERNSPGANSAGGQGTETASSDLLQGGLSTQDAGNSSHDTAARRGDAAAAKPTKRTPPAV